MAFPDLFAKWASVYDSALAESFDHTATHYERGRPGWPPQVLDVAQTLDREAMVSHLLSMSWIAMLPADEEI
jgi:hypothetical protein